MAGKNRKDECCMYIASYVHEKFWKPSLTDRFLFPPSDVSPKVCWDIYANNVADCYGDFMQRTIKDISAESKIVSSSGDIWTYDFATDNSSIEHFT